MNFFSGKDGKAFVQVEAQQATKHRARTCSRAITSINAVITNVSQEIQILLHESRPRFWRRVCTPK